MRYVRRDARDHIFSDGERGAEPQFFMAAFALCVFFESRKRQFEYQTCFVVHTSAYLRDDQAFVDALEQLNAVIFFQFRDRHAHRGLCHV